MSHRTTSGGARSMSVRRRWHVPRGADHASRPREPVDQRGQAIGDRRVILDDRDADHATSLGIVCSRLPASPQPPCPARSGIARTSGSLLHRPARHGAEDASAVLTCGRFRTVALAACLAACRLSASGSRTVMTVPLPIRDVASISPAVGRRRSRGRRTGRDPDREPDAGDPAGYRHRTSSGCPRPRRPARGRAPSTSARPPTVLIVTWIVPDPGACSMALASRLRKTCSRRPASARTITGWRSP